VAPYAVWMLWQEDKFLPLFEAIFTELFTVYKEYHILGYDAV
jgi:hypothetical protein